MTNSVHSTSDSVGETVQAARPMPKLPSAPLYAFFGLPRGRLLKVHAEPCMYAPGYLQSNKPRWPRDEQPEKING